MLPLGNRKLSQLAVETVQSIGDWLLQRLTSYLFWTPSRREHSSTYIHVSVLLSDTCMEYTVADADLEDGECDELVPAPTAASVLTHSSTPTGETAPRPTARSGHNRKRKRTAQARARLVKTLADGIPDGVLSRLVNSTGSLSYDALTLSCDELDKRNHSLSYQVKVLEQETINLRSAHQAAEAKVRLFEANLGKVGDIVQCGLPSAEFLHKNFPLTDPANQHIHDHFACRGAEPGQVGVFPDGFFSAGNSLYGTLCDVGKHAFHLIVNRVNVGEGLPPLPDDATRSWQHEYIKAAVDDIKEWLTLPIQFSFIPHIVARVEAEEARRSHSDLILAYESAFANDLARLESSIALCVQACSARAATREPQVCDCGAALVTGINTGPSLAATAPGSRPTSAALPARPAQDSSQVIRDLRTEIASLKKDLNAARAAESERVFVLSQLQAKYVWTSTFYKKSADHLTRALHDRASTCIREHSTLATELSVCKQNLEYWTAAHSKLREAFVAELDKQPPPLGPPPPKSARGIHVPLAEPSLDTLLQPEARQALDCASVRDTEFQAQLVAAQQLFTSAPSTPTVYVTARTSCYLRPPGHVVIDQPAARGGSQTASTRVAASAVQAADIQRHGGPVDLEPRVPKRPPPVSGGSGGAVP